MLQRAPARLPFRAREPLLVRVHLPATQDLPAPEHVTPFDLGPQRVAAVGGLEEAPESICVDVTSGTKTMTLAMMRVAAVLHAECAYVSARFDGANRLPNTQQAHGFSPQLASGAHS